MLMYMASVPMLLTLRASTIVADTPEMQRRYLEEHRHEKETSVWRQIWRWLLLRNFMLKQSVLLFVLLIIIAIVEDDRLAIDPNFTMFSVLYEVSSAFGNVGLSLGYPNTVTSFSAQWRWGSKLLLCVVMLMGRHRGLPYKLDAAMVAVSRARDEASVSNEFELSPDHVVVEEGHDRDGVPRKSFVLEPVVASGSPEMVLHARNRTRSLTSRGALAVETGE
jgi:hypothetical protein